MNQLHSTPAAHVVDREQAGKATLHQLTTPPNMTAGSAFPAAANDDRRVIRVGPGELRRIVKDAEQYLASTGRHFQYGGAIVTIREDKETGASAVEVLDEMAIQYALDEVAWKKLDKRSGDWILIDPPARPCKTLIALRDYGHLPVLSGIAHQPFLRQDGSLCDVSGYDITTRAYGAYDTTQFAVPGSPTRQEAIDALRCLTDLLAEFSFPAESDRSAALAGILTAAARSSLGRAPMFHVRAPQISSGKSYLCELIATFATAHRGSPMNFPSGDAECSKLLSSELMRAPAVIEFDNLTTDLVAHKSLCTALTSECMTARILGFSKTLTFSTRTLFLSSGNNVGPVADMTRRVVTINLDPAVEMPATRLFAKPDLVASVKAERGRYVGAALTVILAWVAARKPVTPCQPFGSFGEWSDLCRQPLLWLGQADPAQSVFDGLKNDPDREVLSRLLKEWHVRFGSDPTMVRNLVERAGGLASDAENLRDAIIETGNHYPINRRKLGWWLRRHVGQVVGGMKLLKASTKLNAEAWQVVLLQESVSSVSSLSSVMRPVDSGSGDATENAED